MLLGVVQREYGITGERGAAYTKAYEDLEIGRVKGASVYFEGDSIVVYKKLRFNVPFVDKYNFGIKSLLNSTEKMILGILINHLDSKEVQ